MRVKQREALCTPFVLPPPAAKEKKGSIWGHPTPRQGAKPPGPPLSAPPPRATTSDAPTMVRTRITSRARTIVGASLGSARSLFHWCCPLWLPWARRPCLISPALILCQLCYSPMYTMSLAEKSLCVLYFQRRYKKFFGQPSIMLALQSRFCRLFMVSPWSQ